MCSLFNINVIQCVCVYVYIYIYTYVYIYIYMYKQINRIHIHMCIYIYIYTHTHIGGCEGSEERIKLRRQMGGSCIYIYIYISILQYTIIVYHIMLYRPNLLPESSVNLASLKIVRSEHLLRKYNNRSATRPCHAMLMQPFRPGFASPDF